MRWTRRRPRYSTGPGHWAGGRRATGAARGCALQSCADWPTGGTGAFCSQTGLNIDWTPPARDERWTEWQRVSAQTLKSVRKRWHLSTNLTFISRESTETSRLTELKMHVSSSIPTTLTTLRLYYITCITSKKLSGVSPSFWTLNCSFWDFQSVPFVSLRSPGWFCGLGRDPLSLCIPHCS